MAMRCHNCGFLISCLCLRAITVVECLLVSQSPSQNKTWVDYLPRFGESATGGNLRGDGITLSTLNTALTTDDEDVGAHERESEADAEKRNPRVVFLFLTRTGPENEDLWVHFFRGAKSDQYQAFAHCVNSTSCAERFKKRNEFGIRQVKTVPTEYCTNLVGAMVQLLKEALQRNHKKEDKFVFLSESTLPVKPFQSVYGALTSNGKSDLCVHRSSEWPRGVDCHVVKHSQWVVLNRNHAQIVTQNWEQIKRRYKDHTFTVPMLDPAKWRISGVRTMHDSRLCTDEWGIFASIYGAVPFHSRLDDPNLNPDPLRFDADKPQGVCHTFAFWSEDKSMKTEVDMVRSLGEAWPHTRMDCKGTNESETWKMPRCWQTHPVSITMLDDAGARIMRDSPFLFVRKFRTGVVSLHTFKKELLRPAAEANSTWWR